MFCTSSDHITGREIYLYTNIHVNRSLNKEDIDNYITDSALCWQTTVGLQQKLPVLKIIHSALYTQNFITLAH